MTARGMLNIVWWHGTLAGVGSLYTDLRASVSVNGLEIF